MARRLKPRPHKSKIWMIPDEDMRRLVSKARSLSEVLVEIGLRAAGGNHRVLRQRLDTDRIDYSHIPMGLGNNSRGSRHSGGFRLLDEEVLCENSIHSRKAAKERFVKLVKDECAICGQQPLWNGSPMKLILDHINGIFNDHRVENLRLVCPNCNSQLDTFCSRNMPR